MASKLGLGWLAVWDVLNETLILECVQTVNKYRSTTATQMSYECPKNQMSKTRVSEKPNVRNVSIQTNVTNKLSREAAIARNAILDLKIGNRK